MDTFVLRTRLRQAQDDLAAISALLPPVSTVHAGGNLQAALDVGGEIALEDGATWEGRYEARVSGTRVYGPNAALRGTTAGPALVIPPGSHDIQVVLGTATTAHDDSVIQVGENNSNQTSSEQAPSDITLTITVPTHRGKRAFAIHGRRVSLLNCVAKDVYDPGGRDSQGIYIENSPGDILVQGGSYEAGSENVLIGGDHTAIPGLIPRGVVFSDLTLSRPLSWRTDGIKRKVKALFELKSGAQVMLRRARLDGCWVDGQVGYAGMITPRNGATISDVVWEDVSVRNVGGLMEVMGYDNEDASGQTRGVTLRRVDAAGSTALGTGWGLFLYAEPKDVVVDSCVWDGDGTATIYTYTGDIRLADGTTRPSGPIQGFSLTGSRMTMRQYGVITNGNPNANHWSDALLGGVISGNTFLGANALVQKNLPGNTFTG